MPIPGNHQWRYDKTNGGPELKLQKRTCVNCGEVNGRSTYTPHKWLKPDQPECPKNPKVT